MSNTLINEKDYPVTVRFTRVQDQIKWVADREEEAERNLKYFEKSDNPVMRSYWEGQLTMAGFFKEKMLNDFKKQE